MHNGPYPTDMSAINECHKLKYLIRLNKTNSVIELNNFPDLEKLDMTYIKNKILNIEKKISLRTLGLSNFPFEDLSLISNLTNLKTLGIDSSKNINLKGIEKLTNLEKIDMNYLRNLQSLEGITEAHTKLKYVFTYSTPNLTDISALRYIKHPDLISVSVSKKEPVDFSVADQYAKEHVQKFPNVLFVDFRPEPFNQIIKSKK